MQADIHAAINTNEADVDAILAETEELLQEASDMLPAINTWTRLVGVPGIYPSLQVFLHVIDLTLV